MSQIDYVHYISNIVWTIIEVVVIYLMICVFYYQRFYKILRFRKIIYNNLNILKNKNIMLLKKNNLKKKHILNWKKNMFWKKYNKIKIKNVY